MKKCIFDLTWKNRKLGLYFLFRGINAERLAVKCLALKGNVKSIYFAIISVTYMNAIIKIYRTPYEVSNHDSFIWK